MVMSANEFFNKKKKEIEIIIITLLLLLLLPLFFAPFFPPVSLALFICPWVSEDGGRGRGLI